MWNGEGGCGDVLGKKQFLRLLRDIKDGHVLGGLFVPNSTLRNVLCAHGALIASLHLAGKPWIFEVPHGLAPGDWSFLDEVTLDPSVRSVTTDWCMWGGRWKRRTRFVVGNVDCGLVEKLNIQCRGNKCKRTGKVHWNLCGDAWNGVPKAMLASRYPALLSFACASLLVDEARSSLYNT